MMYVSQNKIGNSMMDVLQNKLEGQKKVFMIEHAGGYSQTTA